MLRSAVLFALLSGLVPAKGQPGYAPPNACSPCHSEIASSYASTGMARGFRKVRPGEMLEGFNSRVFAHEASGQSFRMVQRDGRPYMRREAGTLDPQGLEKEVHYIFGSGNHARSFLSRIAGGRLVELPLTWYAEEGGKWAMNPAFDRPDHPGFTREIGYRCMFCHNGYPTLPTGSDWADNSGVFPEQLPEGIDCQRCHGPGAAHVDAASKGATIPRIRAGIVNPARLAIERQLEICMQCHLETTSLSLPAALTLPGRGVFSFKPGEALMDYALHFQPPGESGHFDLVSAVTRLRESTCFQKAARMTCTTCHDPHRIQRGDAAMRSYSAACQSCHSKVSVRPAHENPTECISCHMPKRRAEDVIHVSVTDHKIAVRPDLRQPTVERHDGNSPPYRGRVQVYYPKEIQRDGPRALSIAIAQVKHQANLKDGIQELEQAITRWQPAHSEPYFELAEAWRSAGDLNRAEAMFAEACRRQPVRWLHYYGYALTLTAAGKPTAALEALTRASKLAPEEPKIPFAAGEAYAQLNNRPLAVAAYRRALALNPDLAEVWNNLGTTLLAHGDRSEAEHALRKAVHIRPDLTPAQVNLANLLLGQRPPQAEQLDEAIARYRVAVRAMNRQPAPQLAAVHLNLGLALAARGRKAEAISEWQAAASGTDPEVQRAAKELLLKYP